MIETSSVLSALISAPARDDVVEAAYLAMKLISHGPRLARFGIDYKVLFDREPRSSKANRRLALDVVDEIIRREAAPLEDIPQEKLDSYTKAIAAVVRNRYKQDLQYDEEHGRMLLDALRRADEPSAIGVLKGRSVRRRRPS